jgi:hypothetical protein
MTTAGVIYSAILGTAGTLAAERDTYIDASS